MTLIRATERFLEVYTAFIPDLNVRVFGKEIRFEPAGLLRLALRFATTMALAVWFGGFTFYSTAVIATSQEVLHSHLRAGLITQQVTNWLNWISLPALVICGGTLIAERRNPGRLWVWLMALAFAGMVVMQVTLFPAHHILDSRIVDHQIADDSAFFRLHRVYLVLATLQWCATVAYIWAMLALWMVRTEKSAEITGATLATAART